MSFRTNRRTRKVFKLPDRVPTGRPLIMKLAEIASPNEALVIILVRDGLKPASFVYIPESRVDEFTNFLVSLGLVWSKGQKIDTPLGGKRIQIYLAKNTRNLQRLRQADEGIAGETGTALGFPLSATKFFYEQNKAYTEAEKKYPFPTPQQRLDPEYGKARREAYAKAEKLPRYEKSVFFVYGKDDLVSRRLEDSWKKHLTEKYGTRFD